MPFKYAFIQLLTFYTIRTQSFVIALSLNLCPIIIHKLFDKSGNEKKMRGNENIYQYDLDTNI